jgi:hypothetical protein
LANILIVYYYREYPPRANLYDNIYSFKRYSGHTCFYVNLFCRRVPRYLAALSFDLIIFHKTFLGFRFHPWAFERVLRRSSLLKTLPGVKIALPQDEFIYTAALGNFINEFGIDAVFSVAPPSEWPKIYDTVDRSRVRFYQVLTGYLDEKTLQTISRLAAQTPRNLDIGYRATPAFFLGRFGLFKSRLAEAFQAKAAGFGLITDILVSNRLKDFFWGDDWYRFLLRCKYTLGVEGGASLLDPDGARREKIARYQSRHPEADFNEVEAHCFPGRDGGLDLRALSPRHLEACATHTCQVLVEGDYNGILKAGRHYLELKKDFSNVDDLLETIKSDARRAEITALAYRDLVASGRYTYANFVAYVLEQALGAEKISRPEPPRALKERLIHRWLAWTDRLSWLKAAIYTRSKNLIPDVWLTRVRELREKLQG